LFSLSAPSGARRALRDAPFPRPAARCLLLPIQLLIPVLAHALQLFAHVGDDIGTGGSYRVGVSTLRTSTDGTGIC